MSISTKWTVEAVQLTCSSQEISCQNAKRKKREKAVRICYSYSDYITLRIQYRVRYRNVTNNLPSVVCRWRTERSIREQCWFLTVYANLTNPGDNLKLAETILHSSRIFCTMILWNVRHDTRSLCNVLSWSIFI